MITEYYRQTNNVDIENLLDIDSISEKNNHLGNVDSFLQEKGYLAEA